MSIYVLQVTLRFEVKSDQDGRKDGGSLYRDAFLDQSMPEGWQESQSFKIPEYQEWFLPQVEIIQIYYI